MVTNQSKRPVPTVSTDVLGRFYYFYILVFVQVKFCMQYFTIRIWMFNRVVVEIKTTIKISIWKQMQSNQIEWVSFIKLGFLLLWTGNVDLICCSGELWKRRDKKKPEIIYFFLHCAIVTLTSVKDLNAFFQKLTQTH